MGALYRIALVLVIIGAINWGLIGFFKFDLVASLFGGQTAGLSRIIYALVGLAGLACIPLLMKNLDEKDNATVTHTRATNRPNYNMEAGKEADFSEYAKQKNKNNKNENNEKQ
ncbi:DUF378 domain-containing protein [Solibacillus sp. FSL R5-0691]|uniref:DUF378 domain-containing protein n=1 Tax=Solibacillus sp. FSL R5-0691 TaxID=2921653 RepID=UPI0030CDD76A